MTKSIGSSINRVMTALEEIEQRVSRLETLFEDLLKEKIAHISTRHDLLYEKKERDKSEILAKTELERRSCWRRLPISMQKQKRTKVKF